jgi:tetratricopeptide (TPR) repeat protein
MQTQQQIQPFNELHRQTGKLRGSTRKQRIITAVIIAISATTVIAAAQVLSILCIIPDYWFTILSAVAGTLGVLFAFLALLPVLFPESSTASVSKTSQVPVRYPYRSLAGLPPPTEPETIQQRENFVKEAYAMLAQPDTTCVVLTGIGGIGKSTLAALTYRYAETQREMGRGLFSTEPLWLSVDPPTTMNDLVANLFAALGKPQPDFSNLSPQSQAAELFKALNTMSKPRLVMLDQFENLLNPQTGYALSSRPGIGEWLDTLNNQKFEQSSCRILITSRLQPKGAHYYSLLYMKVYEIRGLELMEGTELLRKQGVVASEAELREAVNRCEGHALALTLLAGLLKQNHSLSLKMLLNDPLYNGLWAGDIACNFLDYTYKQQLDEVQRQLMLAFSVYREAVPLAAAQQVVNYHAGVPKMQILSAFQALLSQHLLQPSGQERYRLHAIVASYARDHFDESDDTANLRARQAAHTQAAQYYLQQAKTSVPLRDRRRHTSDIHDLTEATWQLCEAGKWQEAYNLMQQEDIFVDLRRWGDNVLLLELCELLLPLDKWQPEPAQAAHIYNHLGRLYDNLGKTDEALATYERVLSISRQIHDGKREGVALNNLGRLYKEQGKTNEALACFEQALIACRTTKDRGGEGTTFNNLGSVYAALSRPDEARSCLEQALSIFRGEAKYPAGEARALNSLGRLSADPGEKEQARDYYEQALSIYQNIGDRRGEGNALNNLGNISAELGQSEQARKSLEQALSLRKELGNRWAEAMTLNDLGRVYDIFGEKVQAWDCYKQALGIFREEKAHREEGKTLLNFGMLYLDQVRNDVALACFLLAKSIFVELNGPERGEAQKQIDDLHAKVGEKEFAVMLAQVEPQTRQIVERGLNEGF